MGYGVLPPAWQSWLPEIGSIVLCYFPFTEDSGKPASSVHPCIVIKRGKFGDEFFMLVAYGSKRGIGAADATNVVVDPSAYPNSGLEDETRFQLSRRAWLPYNTSYFMQAGGKRTPIIGMFPTELQADFDAAKAEVEARPGANWGDPAKEP